MLAYLDDWLLLGPDAKILLQQTQRVADLLQRLSWVVAAEKSQMSPQPIFPFIGAIFDPTTNTVTASEPRIQSLARLTGVLCKTTWLTARDMMEVLGHLASLIAIVPLARLHMRGLQMCLLRQWRTREDRLTKPIILDRMAIHDLEWWSATHNWQGGGPIWELPTQTVITTDASTKGWGAHWEDHTAQGVWSDQEKEHINALEMRAVIMAITCWQHLLKGKNILIRSDNIATVQYINRQGGTISPQLCQLAVELGDLAVQNNMWIAAAHIKGVLNVVADSLSRGTSRIPWSEWSLCPQIVRQVFNIYGTPNIDLFALRHNNKLPTYCSWDRDPMAFAQDSLSIERTNLFGFAYPPISLIPRVLKKARQAQSRILLVAPWWPLRPWFPDLLHLLIDIPTLLPAKKDLL